MSTCPTAAFRELPGGWGGVWVTRGINGGEDVNFFFSFPCCTQTVNQSRARGRYAQRQGLVGYRSVSSASSRFWAPGQGHGQDSNRGRLGPFFFFFFFFFFFGLVEEGRRGTLGLVFCGAETWRLCVEKLTIITVGNHLCWAP
ncbi:hypothetical protein PspLS_08043 [Pyricularia sp. CBS 133598]|nr:hypothetical protein PspLS_08043 [Pyricularia sp. CBS 133598]